MCIRAFLIFAAMPLTLVGVNADDALDSMLGRKNVYVRVSLERPNGIDMRARVMPQRTIDALEKQGKAVRPSRTSANVSYWAFFANGDFATADVVNNPALSDLSHQRLESLFQKAPRDGTMWKKGPRLVIGPREFSVRLLDADDPVTGGRKGELEIAVVEGGDKRYYYFGSIVREAP